MKKVVVLAVVAAVAFAAYQLHRKRQAPFDAYTAFAQAVARGHMTEARSWAVPDLQGEEEGQRFQAVGWVPIEALHSIRYTLDSRDQSADGNQVTLVVRQLVYFDPPGATSAMGGAMIGSFKQEAVMRRTPQGWRVASFKNDFLGARETR